MVQDGVMRRSAETRGGVLELGEGTVMRRGMSGGVVRDIVVELRKSGSGRGRGFWG
jgi:hypothetical protein